MEFLYILSEIRCPFLLLLAELERGTGQVFSMAFIVFHTLVKCSVPPLQVYSVLLFTFERNGSSLNSSIFLPFSILDNSIMTLHVRFMCIVVKICYKTSYKAPLVADIFSILTLQASS